MEIYHNSQSMYIRAHQQMQIGKTNKKLKGGKKIDWNLFCPKHALVTPGLYTRGLGEKLLKFLSKN